MNQIRQLAGQTAIYGMGTIVPKLLNWAVLTPFYTRVFDNDSPAFGSITELYAYVVILNVLITFGMETGFFRFSQDKSSFKSVYTTALLVVLALATVFVGGVHVFIEPIASLIRYEENWQYISWFSIIIALDCLAAIPFAKLRKEERAKKFTMLKLVNIGINMGLVFFFLLIWPALYAKNPEAAFNQWYNPEFGVGYVFLANLITSGIVFLLIAPEFRHLGGPLRKDILIKLLRFSAPLVIVGIAGSINEVADKILLKFLLPDQENSMMELGQYGASYRIAVIMTLFIQMFRYAFEPFLFARKKEGGNEIYAQIMEVFVAIGLIVFLATVFYLDLVKHFLGDGYHEGLEIVPIVLMANLFLGVFYSLSVWYKLTDLTKFAALLALGGSVITIVANLVLIPKLAYLGSAWAHLMCYGSMMIASYFLGKKYFAVPYKTLRIGSYFVLALLLYFGSIWLAPANDVLKYAVNTIMLVGFIMTVNWKSQLFKILLRREVLTG